MVPGDATLASGPGLWARIEGQLRRGCSQGSRVVPTEAFDIFLWDSGALFYRNRALPVRSPRVWAPAIAEMVRRFEEVDRTPRLEFLAERWPELGPALEVAGFRREGDAPVMLLARPPAAMTSEVETRLLDGTDERMLGAVLDGLERAFDLSIEPFTEAERVQLGRELRAGTTQAAVAAYRGQPVAGAQLVGVGAEAELAAVWTDPEWRRRGLAGAVCSALLRAFFQGGGELVWLSAPEPEAQALYRGLGFVPVATQLNYAAGA